jgi:hypothetical protein
MSSKEGPRKSRRPPPPAGKQPTLPDRRQHSSPDITVSRSPVGRNTLHAIWEELQQDSPNRGPLVTLGYEEAPAPPPTPPPPAPKKGTTRRIPMSSMPDISIRQSTLGRETMLELSEVIGREGNKAHPAATAAWKTAKVFELHTFVVLEGALAACATLEEKLGFVKARLAGLLPGGYESVRRVEVRPADDEALLMRVWCEVPTR